MTNIRTVVGSMDLDQLLSHRDEINERLLRVLDAAASPWGAKVTRVEIKDILPPADLAGAMARQMKAEREKRAAVLEAEGLRQAEILRAEGDKQSQILAAEGRKEAAFRDAEARERQAEAEAKATSMVSDAIAQGDLAAANFIVAEKYIEALRAMATAPNQKVVIVPIEAAALAGSLGGIAELTKSVFGEGGASTSPAAPYRRSAGGAAAHDRERRSSSLGAWAWIILGVALSASSFWRRASFFIWLGLAAIATGLLDAAFDLSWQLAALVFAVLAVAAVVLGRSLTRPQDAARHQAASLNRRGEALVGRVFTLEAPIVDGAGRIRVDDSSWRVTGPSGRRRQVRVVRVEGTTLWS